MKGEAFGQFLPEIGELGVYIRIELKAFRKARRNLFNSLQEFRALHERAHERAKEVHQELQALLKQSQALCVEFEGKEPFDGSSKGVS
jgi:hypothetical protein